MSHRALRRSTLHLSLGRFWEFHHSYKTDQLCPKYSQLTRHNRDAASSKSSCSRLNINVSPHSNMQRKKRYTRPVKQRVSVN